MPEYDVFLSHNSADKPAVERLARRLADEAGLRLFLDKWHLVPGEPWQEALEEALDQSRTCAVFIGPRGISPWEHEEMRAAIEQRVADRAFRVIPVLLPGAERGERGRLPAFLTRATWVEFRESLDDPDAFHRLVAGIKGIPPGRGPGEVVYEGICPYRGLQVFEEEHAPFFFGREAATEWLVNDLRGSRFLAVVGPSGSGKSSLVRAGLVPALRRGDLPGSETWPLCVFRPGHRPLESLAVALIHLVGPADEPTALSRLMDALLDDQRQLHLTTRLALTDAPADRAIALVVDQFEEIFTLCRNEEQRGPFIDNLLYASAIEGGRTVVVLTMRADFYGKCAAYPDLAARFTDHQMLVSPMVEEELCQAIERPAQLVGLEFESGLVETLLRDVQAEPGALPLLQHTLLELWERREGHRLTFAAYRDIGGMQGAIAHRAESIYAGFDAAQQAITRRIMLRLTQPGEGTEDTRRRAQKSELWPTGEQAEATEVVIQTLTDARLVTTARDMATGEEQVDVSHEALIRGWPRLREWIDEDRAGLRTHRRLTEAAREWERKNRDESYLYRGARLAEAEEWAETHADDLNPVEREFLGASVALRDREAQEAERQRQRELEQARRLAEEQRKRAEEQAQAATQLRKQALWLRVALIIAAIAAVAAIWFAGQVGVNVLIAQRERDAAQRERDAARIAQAEAERQSRISLAQSLAAQAPRLTDLTNDHELATLLALEALYLNHDAGGNAQALIDNSLRAVLSAPYFSTTLLGHTFGVTSVAFSPDGRTLASGSADGAIRLWDLRTPGTQPRVLIGPGFDSVAFSPDGQTLASGNGDGTIWLCDLRDPEVPPRVLRGHHGGVISVAFSPDGRTLASGSHDGTIRLWDLHGPEAPVRVLSGHNDRVPSVAFSPDGQTLASGSWDSTIWLWDLSDLEASPHVLSGHDDWVYSVAFSPDSQTLASGNSGGTIRLWDLRAPEAPPRVLRGHNGKVSSVAFSPDGVTLASGGWDRTIRLWNLRDPQAPPRVLHGHVREEILSIAFSPDGQTLASSSNDGTIRLWDLRDPEASPRVLHGHDGSVVFVAFSHDSQTLASGSADRTIRVWDLSDPEALLRVFHVHDAWIWSMAFSPDGQTLASGNSDGTIRVWDLRDPEVSPRVLHGHDDGIRSVAFSPDGVTLASGGSDRTIRLWDLRDLEASPRVLHGHDGSVVFVAFSPDGQSLASDGSDGTIRLWDLSTPETPPHLLYRHYDISLSAALSPDGQTLASGNWDGTIWLWDFATGAPPQLLSRHDAQIVSVAFSADGQTLASGSADRTIQLWDLSNLEALPRVLSGHDDTVSAVAFSPDSQILASGSWDNTIRLWITPDALVDLACQKVRRNLTQAEWDQYLPGEPYRQTCPNLPPGE